MPAFRRRSLPPVFPRGVGAATRRLVGDFWGSLISQILDFSGFAGKIFADLDFRLLKLVGIIFRGFHVQYLKVTKNGSHLVVFVTLFATNFIEVQQYKKARSKYLFLLEGVCFHGI